MRRITCPYLGLKDDPTTTLNFPSPGNYCFQARPVASVKGAYQEKYCLTANHAACPLYRASHPMPLPAAIAARTASPLTGRQWLAMVGVPMMVVAIAFFSFLLSNFNWQNLLAHPIPDTGPGVIDNNFGLLGANRSLDRTPITPSTPTARQQAPSNTCPQPANWVTYTVEPTDSLFRLSVIYGVSVEDLQRANCMGNQTVILPGKILYIPFIPTDTPVNNQDLPSQALPTNTPRGIQIPLKPKNTSTPVIQPSATETGLPSNTPVVPTALPTSTTQPTVIIPPTSTLAPQPTPTIPPTLAPTATQPLPTTLPTPLPTDVPTIAPTSLPTIAPSPLPATELPPTPTDAPTTAPSPIPTTASTTQPTTAPATVSPAATTAPVDTPVASGTILLSSTVMDPLFLQINGIP